MFAPPPPRAPPVTRSRRRPVSPGALHEEQQCSLAIRSRVELTMGIAPSNADRGSNRYRAEALEGSE